MIDTTTPTICPQCGFQGGFHAETCSQRFIMPLVGMSVGEAIAKADREAEYRRVWLDVAMRLFTTKNYAPEEAFDEADQFLDELKKRDHNQETKK